MSTEKNEQPERSPAWPSTAEMKERLETVFPSFSEIDEADRRKPLLRRQAIIDASALLRDMRRECGFSQRDMAARMDISQPAVSQLERGTLDGKGPMLSSLVDYMNYCGMGLQLAAVPLDATDQSTCSYQHQSCDMGGLPNLLNLIDICYVETDTNDRIVRSNGVWKKLHVKIERWTENVLFEDFIKAGMENGLFPAAEKEEDWFERRMENHRAPTEAFDVPRQEGILLEVSEIRKSDGGTITIGKNVTTQRKLKEFVLSLDTLEVG